MIKNQNQKKEILKEYKEELEYFQKTKNLTSRLMLYVALIKNRRRNKNLGRWQRVVNIYDEVYLKANEFIKNCWPDIKKKNDEEEKYRTFRFECNRVTLLSMYTAGRILMTISPNTKPFIRYSFETSERYISIIGDGTADSKSKPGIQGMYATKEEIIGFLQEIISNWDKNKYQVYTSKNVTIL